MLRLIFVCLVCVQAIAALAETRVALVIGNSAYENVAHLPNPTNDASDLAASLGRLGFDVDLRRNLGYREMRLALRDFSEKAESADIALIYFAGHGVEIDRENYLIPVSAGIKSDRDIEFEAVPLDRVLSAVGVSKGLKIVFLDACRNNPFLRTMTRSAASRSIGRGLGRIEPTNIVVGYAAREGTLALDGEGRNSPYARALLDHIEEPGLELGKMLRRVRDQVFTRTEGLQEPFVYGSLPAEDIFLREPAAEIAALAETTSAEDTQSDKRQARIAEMYQEFEKTRGVNTLWSWDRFIDEYQDLKDNQVYMLALERRELAREKNPYYKLQQIRKRPIWIADVKQGPGRSVTLTAAQQKQVQEALNMMGYYVGPPDGVLGPKTRAAVRRLQFDFRLPTGAQGAGGVDTDVLRVLANVPETRRFLKEKAQRYDRTKLPDGVEPRMRRVIEHLEAEVRPLGYKFGYWEGTLYVAVGPTSTNWNLSNQAAREMGGHMATIGSAAENRFITSLFRGDPMYIKKDSKGYLHGPSFGLFQPVGSSEPTGGWAWVNGEPLSYTNWSRGNPDNFGGNQRYGSFFSSRGTFPTAWDDIDSVGWTGFILEIPPQR